MALPELSAQQQIVDVKTGKPTSQFKRFMDQTRAETISADEQLAALIAAQAALLASQTALLASVEAINTTQQEQIDRLTIALRAISHTDGLFIVASADGAAAKIDITTHTRTYVDAAVSVNGGVLSGLAYATSYSIYYDDTARAGGAVTYVATTTPADAVTNAAHPDRHLVGVAITPATSGDPPVDGGGSIPPGYPDYVYEVP